MQFIDNAFIAAAKNDHQILVGDGPMAVTWPRTWPIVGHHFLPFEVFGRHSVLKPLLFLFFFVFLELFFFLSVFILSLFFIF